MLVSVICELIVSVFLVKGSTSLPISGDEPVYNHTDKYPLTNPLTATKFRIAIIADLDEESKFNETVWLSYIKTGNLFHEQSQNKINIEWDRGRPLQIQSGVNDQYRGMELSELVTFNNKILTFDDRTGYIFDITKVVDPKNVKEVVDPIRGIKLKVNDTHPDDIAKGFKSEWATVKDGFLYVGSMGREWRLGTVVKNWDAMYVKKISPNGSVETLDWRNNYKKLREQSYGITDTGYMTHESAVWSPKHNLWAFLPRRCSKENYVESKDGEKGCNRFITADNDFKEIKTVILDPKNPQPTHGFSSFKIIPGTDIIVAIKTVETEKVNEETKKIERTTKTFIVAFDMDGKILYKEKLVSDDKKYEGFEFI